MLKQLTTFIIIYLLVIPLVVSAEGGGVVINSFQVGSENAKDEFVEIKNCSAGPVGLKDWRLSKRTASGAENILLTAFPDKELATGETLIIAHADYSNLADLYYSNKSYSLAVDNTIILYGPIDIATKIRPVIDMVGFGEARDFEGAPTTNPKVSEIYSRIKNGQDTNNNKNDFYLSYAPPVKKETEIKKEAPKSESSFPTATVGAKIQVSEFMINPEGSDAEGEWIEIYNAGETANISGYAIADRLGSPKKYTLPEGTVIKKGEYLAFYSGKTPISLNNDGDAVEVRAPDGAVIHYSAESGKGPEGASFALEGSKWSWTKKPTPGRKNIIEAVGGESNNENTKDGQVLSLVDEKDLPNVAEAATNEASKTNDQLFGYGLIALAILGGIFYTLYINKEQLREFYYNKIRKRDSAVGQEIRRKIKRWRDISANR